jgi:hypothetical protein
MLSLALFAHGQTARPNIVYFLVDDLGFANVGFHSAEHTDTDPKTPHIDSLRADGAELTAFYTYKVRPFLFHLLLCCSPRTAYADCPRTSRLRSSAPRRAHHS